MSALSEHWDVVVMGAGPAGAMSALEAARRGWSVLLLERASWPRWKVCGACLSRGTYSVLRSAGLEGLPDRAGATPLGSLRLVGWGTEATVALPGSMAIARSALDEALVAAAVDAGAQVRYEARARVDSVMGDRRRVLITMGGVVSQVMARVVIDASGLRARPARAETQPPGPDGRGARIGVGAVYGPGTPGFAAGTVHMSVGTGGYAGCVRLGDGSLTVSAAVDRHFLRAQGGPQHAVAAILREAGAPELPERPLRGWKGTPFLTQAPGTTAQERLFLVGDAAGYVEPFTGEGIAWALADARALAPIVDRAAGEWDRALAVRWNTQHRRQVAQAQRLCRVVAWSSRRPRLMRAALGALAQCPAMAGPFVRRASAPPRRAQA